jgi:hypothetical protein
MVTFYNSLIYNIFKPDARACAGEYAAADIAYLYQNQILYLTKIDSI